MADDTARKEAKNGADALILGEIRRQLDWVSNCDVITDTAKRLEKSGIIEGFRFSDPEFKVNGTWYKRP